MEVTTILQHVFNKSSLEDIPLSAIEEMTRQYPYFGAGQFLLAEKLALEGSEELTRQLQKTNLYFYDPLWLHHLVKKRTRPSSNTGNSASFTDRGPLNAPGRQEAEWEKDAEQEEVAKQEQETERRQEAEWKQEAEQGQQGQEVEVQPDAPDPGEEADMNEAANVNEKAAINEASSHSIEAQDEPFTAIEDPIAGEDSPTTSPISEASEITDTPEAAGISGTVETIEEVEISGAVETTGEVEISGAVETTGEAEISGATENPGTAETSGTTIPGNNSAEAIDEKPAFSFDPYHTIDYFASLGIRVSQEIRPDDKLGNQLKSFTQWLKSMKRLPVGDLSGSTALQPYETARIEKIAAHSIEEKDVVTEAMAEVLIKQGKPGMAREVYRKLSLLNPDKNAYFAAKIEELKQY